MVYSGTVHCFVMLLKDPILLSWNSGSPTLVITNAEIEKHRVAAASEFLRLSQKEGGFSFWNGPRYFIQTEEEHNPDGLHFAWPGTIGKVNMVQHGFLCKRCQQNDTQFCYYTKLELRPNIYTIRSMPAFLNPDYSASWIFYSFCFTTRSWGASKSSRLIWRPS